jgi:acetylcholinesterase
LILILKWQITFIERDDFVIIQNLQNVWYISLLFIIVKTEISMKNINWSSTLYISAGDFNFKCPVVELAEILAKYPNRNGSLFGYYFDHRTSVSDWPDWTGVLHGDEIEYVFGVPLKSTSSPYSSNEQWLSRYMMEYWTNFAKNGYVNVYCSFFFKFHQNWRARMAQWVR